jgi:SNF2 family DNA or RNA helicase
LHVRAAGTPAAREEAKSLVRRSRKDGVGRAGEPPVEVVVTTYTYFERESSGDDRKFLRAQDWSYLVLDEAHGVSHKALSPRG